MAICLALILTCTESDDPNLAVRVKVRVGLKLGLGKSLFPVGRSKDQRLPAGPIATAFLLTLYQPMTHMSRHGLE